jgi:CheY-like chemotaxis protein
LKDLAHELRDVLSPVASSLDLLRLRRFEPDASRTMADRVDRGLKAAFAIMDAFILADSCESGTLMLEIVPASVSHILEQTREALAPEVCGRCVFTASPADEVVNADLARTVQALCALLQHASSIALPGSTVEVSSTSAGPKPQIRIHTRTDPQIIPGEDWFRSYRGGAGRRMALRTARCILVLQQGNLEVVARTPGECEWVVTFAGGAAASVAAPAAEPRQICAAPRPSAGESAAAGMRIIIVDDSEGVRRAYREALLALGYLVTEAANAEQALKVIDSDRPDVALIDIHLPGMNGYRLAQAMKARAGSAIRLVMLSGMALDATTRQLSQQAGFDDCLDKMAGPLALHALLRASGTEG